MEKKPIIICGGSHTDKRGKINFINDFNMSEVKRFYVISNSHISIKRGWRGHKIEQRWFYVAKGEFEISIAKIDDFLNYSGKLHVKKINLSSYKPEILFLPPGYATLIQARKKDSILLVYADYSIEQALNDDHIYDLENYEIIIKDFDD